MLIKSGTYANWADSKKASIDFKVILYLHSGTPFVN